MLSRTTTMPIALRDLLALTKPRLSALVLFTCGGGMLLAPGHIAPFAGAMALFGTMLVVAAANALNCYLERDLDRHMSRTRTRPLAAGRMDPRVALAFAFGLTVVAVPALTIDVNPLTGLLAVIALASYVLVYTPMKQKSPLALWVGAVPGAIPPLMGWTAVRGRIEWPGLALFALLFCWQIPHFIAIAVRAQDDYARAGHRVLPLMVSERAVKFHAAVWAALLLAVSLTLEPLGVAGGWYTTAALVLGGGFLAACIAAFFRPAGERRWSLGVFRYSLLYLTALFVALGVDAL